MNRITLPFLLLVVLTATGCEKAQDVPDKPPATSANVAAPAAPNAPPEPPPPRPGRLDLKATAIDVRKDLEGLPAAEVLDAFMRLEVFKSKYESDAQHTKRMKELAGSRLLDEVDIGDVVGFRPRRVNFVYDANKELWKYEVGPEEVGHEFNHFLVYKEALNGQNFPGYAEALPGRHLEFSKDVYLNIKSLKGLSYINGAVKVPAKDAPALEHTLSVLLVGRLVPTYVSANQKLPTDYSEKEVKFQHTLGFKLESVWLVNKQTGQILSKSWTVRKLA
jgi:hypothetical protein